MDPITEKHGNIINLRAKDKFIQSVPVEPFKNVHSHPSGKWKSEEIPQDIGTLKAFASPNLGKVDTSKFFGPQDKPLVFSAELNFNGQTLFNEAETFAMRHQLKVMLPGEPETTLIGEVEQSFDKDGNETCKIMFKKSYPIDRSTEVSEDQINPTPNNITVIGVGASVVNPLIIHSGDVHLMKIQLVDLLTEGEK